MHTATSSAGAAGAGYAEESGWEQLMAKELPAECAWEEGLPASARLARSGGTRPSTQAGESHQNGRSADQTVWAWSHSGNVAPAAVWEVGAR